MRRRNDGRFQELVEVVASGKQSVKDWAAANSVAHSTAKEWSRSAEFRQRVAEIHQAALDAYVATLTSAAGTIAQRLLELAEKGERKDIVRLQACRAVITDLLAVKESAGRDQQIAELIKRIENLEGNQSSG
jgi:ApbE superfamily uncharacterized protein (UPF0280 family)